MKKIILAVSIFFLLSATPSERLAIADIATAGPTKLNSIKNLAGISWWTELGGSLLVSATQRGFVNMQGAGFGVVKALARTITSDDLRVVVGGHKSVSLPAGTRVLVDEGRVRLVLGDPTAVQALDHLDDDGAEVAGVFPVDPKRVILRRHVNENHIDNLSAKDAAQLTDVAGKVSRERWWADVKKLAGWNRHIAAAGNIAARDWIKDSLAGIPSMEVTTQEFQVQGRTSWNVVGILTGERLISESGAADSGGGGDRGLLIVGGHFDSTSERTSSAAPGAEDNASGAAGMIELARVMAEVPRTHDIVFVAFSGEEQGLVGSAAFVEKLPESERARVRGVLTMDMIAFAKAGNSGPLGVLIETESEHAAFARRFADAAAQVTKLQVSTSYNPFGSDHVSFLDVGLPAILAIDSDWNRYDHYHRTTDTADKLTPELAHEILKMNAGALALLAQ